MTDETETTTTSMHAADRRRRRGEPSPQYEYRTVTFARDVPRDETRRLLTADAEYGRWELARSAIYVGGERKVVLRRRWVDVRATV